MIFFFFFYPKKIPSVARTDEGVPSVESQRGISFGVSCQPIFNCLVYYNDRGETPIKRGHPTPTFEGLFMLPYCVMMHLAYHGSRQTPEDPTEPHCFKAWEYLITYLLYHPPKIKTESSRLQFQFLAVQ